MPKSTWMISKVLTGSFRPPTPEEVEQRWAAYWEKERKAGRPVPLSRIPKQEEEVSAEKNSEKDADKKE